MRSIGSKTQVAKHRLWDGLERSFELRFHVGITLVPVPAKCFPVGRRLASRGYFIQYFSKPGRFDGRPGLVMRISPLTETPCVRLRLHFPLSFAPAATSLKSISMATCPGKHTHTHRQHACTHHLDRSELCTQANTAEVTQDSAFLSLSKVIKLPIFFSVVRYFTSLPKKVISLL